MQNIERECTHLFGYCPLNIQDLAAAKAFNYSKEKIISEAARMHYLSERNAFTNAVVNWYEGQKMEISQEEAKIRNERFNNALNFIDTIYDIPVNWMVFPIERRSIVLYIGLPLDDEMIKWAHEKCS